MSSSPSPSSSSPAPSLSYPSSSRSPSPSSPLPRPASSSVADSLCSYCARIPFIPTILDERSRKTWEDYAADPRWMLGSAQRIQSSRCPLCHLVSLAYYEHQRLPDTSSTSQGLSDFEYPTIYWTDPLFRDHSKPWNRGGFSLHKISGSRICFAASVAEDDEQDEMKTSTSEYLLPHTPSVLETDRVKRWMKICESSHTAKCHPGIKQPRDSFSNVFPGLNIMRLVDVEQNNIFDTDKIQRYVALSYVWGSVDNFRLTRTNKELLTDRNGLERAWGLLPRTIQDAILLCRKLRVRYLWVDAICLVQDDKEDLDRGVNVMDQIYEQSWLTIVAACGYNANAGLPGVRPWTRVKADNVTEVKPGVSLGIVTAVDHLIRHSVYGSRAWTFQESLLARRALYFVDDKVFFRCREAEYTESCIDHPAYSTSISDPAPLSLTGESDPYASRELRTLRHLGDVLWKYSQRVLSHDGDAQRALAGINRRFSANLGYEFVEGLPSAAFDAFILFKPYGDLKGTSLRRRLDFPSYSWTGWRGSLDCGHVHSHETQYSLRCIGWLTKHTWIVWYKRGVCGPATLVWDPKAHAELLLRTITWDVNIDTWELTDTERGKEKRGEAYDGYIEREPVRPTVSLGIEILPTTPTPGLQLGIPSGIAYQVLQFWTVSAFFRLGTIDVFEATATLLGKDNVLCGRIFLDNFEDSSAFFQSSRPFEVILLSRTYLPLCMRGDWEFTKIVGKLDLGTTTFYTVMLLSRERGAIAERRGIGSIYQTALSQSLGPGPTWKEILLA